MSDSDGIKWHVGCKGPKKVHILSSIDGITIYEGVSRNVGRASEYFFDSEVDALKSWIKELEEYWALDNTDRTNSLIEEAKNRLNVLNASQKITNLSRDV